MKNQEEWKRRVFERVRAEIFAEASWESFAAQTDNFIYIFGGEGLKDGRMPPHGRYEIWLPDYLERELLKEYKAAAVREGIIKE